MPAYYHGQVPNLLEIEREASLFLGNKRGRVVSEGRGEDRFLLVGGSVLALADEEQ